MGNFTLDIKIDDKGIKSLANAHMSVAMLQTAPDSGYLIVTVLEQPQKNIQIKWNEFVYAYISLYYPLSSYQTILINSYTSTPALPNSLYSYNGYEINSIGTGMNESVQIENKSSPSSSIVAGLAKHFTINNTEKPLSITTTSSILFNGKGTFPIINSYFLTAISNSKVGTVIPVQAIPNLPAPLSLPLPSIAIQPLLLLHFSSSKPNQSVLYNNDNNMFVSE